MKEETIIALAAATGIVILGYKLSGSVSSAVEETGKGLRDTFSGAGAALEYSGLGVYELGSGLGGGVEYLGQGLGVGFAGLGTGLGQGLSFTGKGLYEIGRGAGYGLSGANIQDILQTLLNPKQEASNYNEDQTKNLKQENTSTSAPTNMSASIIPTAQSTLGLTAFQGVSSALNWVSSQSKRVINTITGGAIGGSTSSSSSGSSSNSLKVSTSSSSSGSSTITTQQRNLLLEKLGYGGQSTSSGIVYHPPTNIIFTPTPSKNIKTPKKWSDIWK